MDTYVRSRIDSATRDQAAEALDAVGLSVSDAIRQLIITIVADRQLPFPLKACLPTELPANTFPNETAERREGLSAQS